jgi:GAF domain-containing protein
VAELQNLSASARRWTRRRAGSALRAAITDPELIGRPEIGAVDCYLDNTLLLTDRARARAVAAAGHAPGRMG